jgi:multicomponent Na+:H+ antiporter subunit D
MISPIPPAAIFIIGALLVPFLTGKAKQTTLLLIPVIAFLDILNMPEGAYWVIHFLDYDLTFGKVDRLSMIFGYIFTIMSFIAILYALHVKDDGQHIAALLYAGSALGAVFAGDLLSLFVFLEMMTITSIYLIWVRGTEASYAAGLRYLLVHLFGGLCLLIGIIIHVHQAGSIEFGYIGLNGLGSYLILIGVGINCAFPILHAWLPDAYPEATITGTVFLSVFTTKTAVYFLVRAFPGTELLIGIGAVMTVFPIFFAVIANDLRRVLSYSLINQVGFMVVGIGIGTELSLNGTVSHAFNNILFEGLLFLCMGAIMHQTGKINATDLGGLYKTMPLTTIFCIIGAASISGFPLFSGFVSKSMIISASGLGGMTIVWFMLLFASAGVFHHAGIKIPYFAFFSHDSGIRTKEPPLNMLLAMGIAAFLSVYIGVFPGTLYAILPYTVDFEPYTAVHVVNQLQLLFFSALAFCLLILSGIYPAEIRAINLDADWFYRKGAKVFLRLANRVIGTDQTDREVVIRGS